MRETTSTCARRSSPRPHACPTTTSTARRPTPARRWSLRHEGGRARSSRPTPFSRSPKPSSSRARGIAHRGLSPRRGARVGAARQRSRASDASTHRVHHYSDVRPSARLLGILWIYADELDGARTEFEARARGRSGARRRGPARPDHDPARSHRAACRKLGSRRSTPAGGLERCWNARSRRLSGAGCWRPALRWTRFAGAWTRQELPREESLTLAIAAGAHWQIAECHAALGLLDLSLDDLASADATSIAHPRSTTASARRSPGSSASRRTRSRRWSHSGELDRAATALERLERQGRSTVSAWALATGARCRGLVCSARGDLDGAAQSLESALVEHERLPIPFELGRTLLATGQVHRRRNERRVGEGRAHEKRSRCSRSWARRSGPRRRARRCAGSGCGRCARRADADRADGGVARRIGPQESGDRGGDLRQPEDGRSEPLACLPQAGDPLPRRARRADGRAGAPTKT